ncbi:MAG: phosphotransferase, partial [Nanoarchaeota archaeon]|nr:phosphotransferase [Nanoarchaeota archaeon]
MKEYFKDQYNLVVSNYSSHDVGFNNRANIIVSDQGKFFQKIYQRLVLGELERVIPVIEYLSKLDFPVPQPVKSVNNNFIVDFQGKPSVLFNYLPGKIKEQFSRNELLDVGRNIARLHLSLREYPNLDDFIKNDEDYNSTSWYDHNITLLKKLGSLESRLIVEEYVKLQKQKPNEFDLNELPLSLLHGDFRNENILFQDNKITGITDFECMRYDNRIYDIIFGVIGFCMLKGNLDKVGMNDVLNSYNSISRLKEGELEAFPFMLKLMTWDKWCSIYV